MAPYENAGFEASIESVDWVRGLARALVRNEHEAEDLAQEAWLAALGREPARSAAWKGWFAGVLHNLARARFRGDHRRREREHASARRDQVPGEAELVERLETHELLARAVRQLDEPYRSTIALRYFEGLTPKEIAARTGVPLRTVETRLRRALEQMRERLDARNRGDRRAWVALLMPLAHSRDLAVAGALAMSTKVLIPVAAVAVLGFLWVVRDVGRSPRSELASPAQAATGSVAPLEPPESMRPIETSRRLAVEPAQSATAPPVEKRLESTDSAVPSIHGAVLDEHGAPLAGVPVALVERGGKDPIPGTERITDARGEFELTLPKKKGELDVPSPEWVVVLRPALSLEAGDEHVFVLAPPRAVAGEVVDETGRPLRAAKLELVMPDLRAAIERVLDRCVDQHWRTESSEDGAFVFDPVPDLEACSLRSTLPGYEARTLELAPGDHGDLRIVMTHPLEARAIHGQVVDELGKPVQGAHVALSGDPGGTESRLLAVSTDAGGLFELRLTDADRDARLLRAVKAGKLPAEVSCNSDTPWSPGAWPDPLVLVLRGSVLSIEGVVLDPDGHPVPFAAIANLDASRFGTVEAEWSGTRVEVGEDIEALLAGRSSASGPSASADERGRFELRGLLPKSYRLSAFSSATMQLVVTDPIEAGRRGVEIRFPREERIERIAGRVVSKSGRGLAGAQLWLARRTTPPAATSVRAGDRELTGYGIQADGEGRFEFRDVPLSVERICARSAPQTPEATVMLGGRTDLENLRIVVPLECHFKLDLTGSPLRATSVRVLDAAGQSISFGIHRGNLWINSDEQQVDAATSEAFTVSEDAAMLVLYDADRELARVPLNLVPGELVIVRP